MKTSYLTKTLTDVLDDDDEEHNSADFLELSCNNSSFMDTMNSSISDSIHELLNPKNKLPDCSNKIVKKTEIENPKEFEAVEHILANEGVWNTSLNKRTKEVIKKPDPIKKSKESLSKISLKMDVAKVKALRNPRKALSKTFSSSNLESDNGAKLDVLPDLETILLEKSRSAKNVVDVKKIEQPHEVEIKTLIDNDWLNRNASQNLSDNNNVTSNFSSSSFGLSNLNLKSFNSIASINTNPTNDSNKGETHIEAKYHTADLSDSEYIDSNENLKNEILPIAKKRRISKDYEISPKPREKVESPKKLTEIINAPEEKAKKIPPKPKRKTVQRAGKSLESQEEKPLENRFETDDDSDNDPTFEITKTEHKKEESPEPAVMKRKKSLIKRSKEGISKVTKKAVKLLGRNKQKSNENEDNDEKPQEEEEEINFFIDTEINSIENVPRVSEKELLATEKVFGQFAQQRDVQTKNPGEKLSDIKLKTKKDALKKKIESGTLNDNYVRINMKKKIFVRGKKSFNFSRYKKTLWKKKKAANLDDMRGCDGGVLKCFSCGGVGHFAQQCKQKGDNLLPIEADVEEESTLPTLQQAAEMASEQKLLAHANRPLSIPSTSNDIWKENATEEDDEEMDIDDINMDDIDEEELLRISEEKYPRETNKENQNINANLVTSDSIIKQTVCIRIFNRQNYFKFKHVIN